jgi:hypothetical protein
MSKEAMKLALEAFIAADFGNSTDFSLQSKAYDLAVEALAKQEQDMPKIGCVNHDCDKCKEQSVSVGEPVGEMTARRAEMFMSRFKHEEKMLGPNEQASLDYVIDILVAMQEQGEPVAQSLKDAVFTVLEGFTLDNNVRKILESAYYTTPQQRTWVGLTLEDKKEYLSQDFGGSRTDAMDWTEQRLKCKNGIKVEV